MSYLTKRMITAEDLLNQLPQQRREIIYTSDCTPANIDPVNRSYRSLSEGDEKRVAFEINIPEIQASTIEAFPDDITDSDDDSLFENDSDEFWGELNTDDTFQMNLTRPSFEWDRHVVFLRLPVEEYNGQREYLAGDLFLSSNYRSMYPQNRFRYLQWLADIEKPIERHYISLYLECLERRGIEMGIDFVLDEIKTLLSSQHDKNIKRDLENLITSLFVFHHSEENLAEMFSRQVLTIMNAPIVLGFYKSKQTITPENFTLVLKKLKFKLSIINGNEQLFHESLKQIFLKKYSLDSFPIFQFEITDSPISHVRMHNYNLASEVGAIQYPELWHAPLINEEIRSVYDQAYEMFKAGKRNLRKK